MPRAIEFMGDGDGDELCQPGVFHLEGAPCQQDFTLCGLTLDGDTGTAGNCRLIVGRRVNCPNCREIIRHCKNQ